MGNQVSREQALQAMSVFGNNADWSKLPAFDVQSIIDRPGRAGKHFTRFLKTGSAGIENATAGIEAPTDGVVVNIPVWVDETIPWETGLKNCNTPTRLPYFGDSKIWGVGNHYPKGSSVGFRVITLVNFKTSVYTGEVLGYAFNEKLQQATPRSCFSVGKEYRNLDDCLGQGRIIITTLIPCPGGDSVRTPSVWLDQGLKGARLPLYKNRWPSDHWFAFELTQKTK